jgi:hypothetical protein
MLGKILGGMVDKVQILKDYISDSVTDVVAELNCDRTEIFYMIQPGKGEDEFKIFIYKMENGTPKRIREITPEEIVGE